MTTDPRAALDRLVAALEAHLGAASRRHGEADPAVVAAYQTLADAFETYDEALYTAYDEVTPFVLYDDAEDEADDDDEDDDEDEDDDVVDDVLDDLDDDDLDDEDDEDEDDDRADDAEGDVNGTVRLTGADRPVSPVDH
ncbi:MAG: primosomal protein [Kineosporiaceae bacterium]